MREYHLCHLSMIAVPPVQLVGVAKAAGFDYTGFRLTPSPSTGVDHGTLGDAKAIAELRRVVDDSGVGVLDIEVIRMKDSSAVEASRPLLEAAQALGARYVVATVEDSDTSRRIDTLAAVARVAAECGTSIALEFMLFSSARTLDEAVRIVQAADQPNVVVLADSLHLTRSGGLAADLAKYPASLFPYAQICGANGAGPSNDPNSARAEGVKARLMPDEGDLPVSDFCRALPPDCILGVESPLEGQAEPSDSIALARQMLESAHRVAGE